MKPAFASLEQWPPRFRRALLRGMRGSGGAVSGGDAASADRAAVAAPASPKICFVVAPAGAAGGGMGRVADYMLEGARQRSPETCFLRVVTRNERGILWSVLLTFGAILAIWAARASGRLALVHVHFGDCGSAVRKGAVVVASRLAGVPTVLHLHAVELDHLYRVSPPPLRWLIRLPFRVASTNIVLGQGFRRWLVDELGVAADKVEVVPNGVAVESRPLRPLAAGAGPVELLFLGNLEPRKGVADLLAALAALPPGTPGWRLTLAGGGRLEGYRRRAEDLGIGNRVRFSGWVDRREAQALLAHADALVLPSHREGLPLVILEALGCGTPVLCTPVGAIPELLTDGDTALFCAPGDRADLSRRLGELIASPNLRQRLSERGRRLFAERFTIDAFMASLLDVYRRRCGIDLEPGRAGTK